QGAWLRVVLWGHYRYYGVPLNAQALQQCRQEVSHVWQRSLSRRSQNGYVNGTRMSHYVAKGLPVARIYHPYPNERFGVRTSGGSPVRKPRALGSGGGALGNERPYREHYRAHIVCK